MNKFQNTVRVVARKRDDEQYKAFEKEYGKFEDYVDIVETPGEGPWIQVEFIEKDPEGHKRWSDGLDNLRGFKEIKREVKAELRKGPKL